MTLPLRHRTILLVVGLLWLAPAVAGAQSSEEAESGEEQKEQEAEDEEEEVQPPSTFEEEEELFELREEGERQEDGLREDRLERQRRTEGPLRTMSPEEARQAGFDFGQQEQASDRTTGALLGATAGLLVHGIGHYYVDEPRTGTTLLVLEGVSVALMGSGLTTWFLKGDSAGGAGFGASAFHLGAGLFGLTYLLDVVGALQGGTRRMPTNSRHQRGISIDAGYRFIGARGFPSRHHFQGTVGLDSGTVYGSVATTQDFGINTSNYAADVGVRYWKGQRPWTYGYVEVAGELFDHRELAPVERWRGEVRAGLSVDLGVVAPHLSEVALGAELGVGREWYRLPTESASSGGFAGGLDYIPLETYAHFNVSQRLNVRVDYTKRAGDPLQATRRLAGRGGLEFNYDSTDLFDLELRAEVGGGVAVTGGLILWVWE